MNSHSKNDHTRLHSIAVHDCRPKCPDEGDTFPVILFNKTRKLRAHALRHFANLTEISGWKSFHDRFHVNRIAEVRDALGDIQCPVVRLGGVSHCFADKTICPCYHQCTQIVHDLEVSYIQAIRATLEAAGQTPRYLRFTDCASNCHCWMLSEHPLTIKMVWDKAGKCYNVSTAYSPAPETYASFRGLTGHVHRRAAKEAVRGTLACCTEETWGLDTDPGASRRLGFKSRKAEKPSKTKKKTRKTKRFFAGSPQSVKQYLEQYDSDDDIEMG